MPLVSPATPECAGNESPRTVATVRFRPPVSTRTGLHHQLPQKLARRLPLESLALETDSPVLGPARTERNEPANVDLVRDKLAELRGISPDRVVEATTNNAERVFGLP